MSYTRHIAGTLISKFAGAFITLGVSVIMARGAGKEAVGEISLMVLAITISAIISGVIAGPAVIYYTPRKRLRHLLVPGYITSILCSFIVCYAMAAFHLYNRDYVWPVIALCMLQNISSLHFFVLLGLEKIKVYNLLTLLQVVILISGLSIFFFIFHQKNIQAYLFSQMISFGVAGLIAVPFLQQKTWTDKNSTYGNTLNEILRYGFIMQLATMFQQLNYRLSYYVIHAQLGSAVLGVFALAMQISEGVLLITKSIGTVLFSRMVNTSEAGAVADKTHITMKVSYLATAFCLVILLVIPLPVFEWIFSKDFSPIKTVFWYIAPGILLLSVLNILSTYYSSVNKVYINTWGSFAGLVVLAAVIFSLVAAWDIRGAAIASVISYLSTTLIALAFYLKIEKLRPGSLLVSGKDVRLMVKAVKGFRM